MLLGGLRFQRIPFLVTWFHVSKSVERQDIMQQDLVMEVQNARQEPGAKCFLQRPASSDPQLAHPPRISVTSQNSAPSW